MVTDPLLSLQQKDDGDLGTRRAAGKIDSTYCLGDAQVKEARNGMQTAPLISLFMVALLLISTVY